MNNFQSITALVTPMLNNRQKAINFDALEKNILRQAKSGIHAVCPCGTTGESPTVTHSEHHEVIQSTIDIAHKNGIKVVAGTGSNSTREAVELTEAAAKAGVDACLVVAPYYNKPNVRGLIDHYREINSVGIPIIIYNIPSRTGINISPATISTLIGTCKNIFGVKACNDDFSEIVEMAINSETYDRSFHVYSGDDSLTVPTMAVGGEGVVSVLANIMPDLVVDIIDFCTRGDYANANQVADISRTLTKLLMSLGPNPTAIKALMQEVGYEAGPCRLPLAALTTTEINSLVTSYQTTLTHYNSYKYSLIKRDESHHDLNVAIQQRRSFVTTAHP